MVDEIYEQNTVVNEPMSRVYAIIDEENRIIRLEGEYTLPSDLTDWVLIEEGTPCDKLNLAQTHYLDKPIRDDRGICQYKYVDGKVVERTTEEMDADYVEPIIEESTEDFMLEYLAEIEERLCMMELGI